MNTIIKVMDTIIKLMALNGMARIKPTLATQKRIYLMPDGGAIDLSKIVAISEVRSMEAWSNWADGGRELVRSGLAFEVVLTPSANLAYYVDDIGEEVHDDLKSAWIAFWNERESHD